MDCRSNVVAAASRRARAHDVRACCGHYWRPRHALCSRVLPGECHLPTLGNKSPTTSRGDPSIMEEKRRGRAARHRPSRTNSWVGWLHRFAPPEATPEVAIGLEVASSVTMASTAHLVISELGDLSLQRGRKGAPQRLLRHQAGSTHRLGGLRYAVDHVRPPSTPGRAGTRGYLRSLKTCVRDGVNNILSWCEYIVSIAASAYRGRVGMPTGPLSRVDAWCGAWEAVEDVPCRPCIWLKKGYPFKG